MLSPQVKESNFNDFLKNFRPTFKELTGLDLFTNVKTNPFSKMVNFDDLFYLSKFYVDERWSTRSKKSAEGTPLIEEKADPFYAMLAFNLPDRFQANYTVDFGELSGLRSDNFEKIKAALEILPVQYLKVTNVADHNFDYKQFFPILKIVDLEVDGQNIEAFYIGRAFSSINTIRVLGVENIQFEADMDRGNLSQVVVSQNTKILRLPEGIEIIRE
jgi:hypothetical protein